MREKELRLALVCYGGISLAVYMHGITKEIWRLARASRDFHERARPATGSQAVYRALLETIEAEAGVRLRVLVDIVTGASAGGINGIFLAQAIASGRSLEPLTELWLERADVDVLLAPDRRPLSRATKFWATPVAWMISRRPGNTIDATVAPETREEVRAKLSRFVRAKWFRPPFGGPGFTNLILDALEAMRGTPDEGALLPPGQPLDLFVTVTDFHGHPERLRLNSPPEIVETEHRLILAFADHGRAPRHLGDEAELAFAARATASFPGAFPPFSVGELDRALAERNQRWPGRDGFLARVLPRHHAVGMVDSAVLIDGSVLANAPFGPAIAALRDRPARREVDRRFVYIDPRPGAHSIGMGAGNGDTPGFFRTIFGAMSDIPREQPIRDNLEAIERHSARIANMRRLIESIRPEVEAVIAEAFDRTLFLTRPTPARLAAWRRKAQDLAARRAGYAYASYGHLKLAGIVAEIAATLGALGGVADPSGVERVRGAIWSAVHAMALDGRGALSAEGASEQAIAFFRRHDLHFRIRRLRFLVRRLGAIEESGSCPASAVEDARSAIFATLADHLDRQRADFFDGAVREAAVETITEPALALDALAVARDLAALDVKGEELLAAALGALPKPERRELILAWLGFPFYDIATLPLLQGEGLEEFDPVKVDRIAPEDARSIREGGAEASLKGIQFNSFGAFFSRAYRENDYLWGRLHGAERLIDIVVSTLPEGKSLPPGAVADVKRDAFRAIVAEERERLEHISPLFEALEREIG